MTFKHMLPGVLMVSALALQPLHAQEDQTLQPVVEVAQETNESAADSQQRINQITDQIDDKLQQFRTLNKEIEGLQVYNTQLQRQIESQEQEMADLNEAIDEVSVIERQITPLMLRMIEGLEQFVALDVPFLPEERAKRIADLKDMMNRADVAPSEKFRRLMEAYEVEMNYGNDVEAYSGLHTINGTERDVQFLRIGRTVLLYQTRDGSYQGRWNQQTRQWEELPSSYSSQIAKGLRIAKQQMAPEVMMMPVAITD